MPKSTYLFYDIETTGLNQCFDQVLQFAAIRTDLELNELERHELIVKLNPDTVPSAFATITHRIGLSDVAMGISEFEAMQLIHQLLNTPYTISLGYNTLGFDDEFLRFGFYRNLLTPYTHQYANGCSRMDLYPIAILYYLFCPTVLQWPEGNLKLENLSRLNQLATGQAHNAMVDVIATVELAKRFMAETKMWDYVRGYFDKKIDLDRMNQLSPAYEHIDARFKEALLIQGSLGTQNFYQAPVLALGSHLVYKNQSMWLRLDYPNLVELPKAELAKKAYVFRKRVAEPPILLPTHPRFLNYLSKERIDQAHANKAFLAKHPETLKELCDYHQNYCYPDIENVDLDAALYQRGFPSSLEERLNAEFHRSYKKQRSQLLEQFLNPKQLEQAIRIIGRNDPESLNETHRHLFNDYLNQVYQAEKENAPIDYKGNSRLTRKAALAEIAELRASQRVLDEQQLQLLEELESYLLERA